VNTAMAVNTTILFSFRIGDDALILIFVIHTLRMKCLLITMSLS
jgi:hypothetical protein